LAANLLKRDFAVEWPYHEWLSHISYVPTREGWFYLAAILDLYALKIVGWALSERMIATLCLQEALPRQTCQGM